MRILSILIFAFLLIQTNPFAQTNWYKYSNNPVLEKGVPGEWDSQGIGIGAYVLFNNDTLRMWYHGQQNNVDAIGYAWSLDGITWTKYENNPVIELGAPGSWDGLDLQMGCVIIDGETYKMYYDGHGSEGWAIGLATSPDGIHWTKNALNNPVLTTLSGTWYDRAVWSPHIIKDDTTYKMWFTADELPAGSARRIGYAESSNGIDWSVPELVIEEVEPTGFVWYTESPSVIFNGENYQMWYSREKTIGTHQIDYAVSADGIDWIKDSPNNPVLAPGSWDYSIYHPNVIEINGLYRMWYVGGDEPAGEGAIGYAEDFSNLVHVDEVIIEDKYVNPNTGALNVLGSVINKEGHAVTVKAFILNEDGSAQDSVELFDDGQNGDGDAGDGIYGAFKTVTGENNYTVGIRTVDEVTGFTRNGLDWNITNRFTSIGPVEFEDYEITSTMGSQIRFKLKLRNNGLTETAVNITAMISTTDSCISEITNNSTDFGDIPAGGSVIPASAFQNYVVDINPNCPNNIVLRFNVDIYSNNYLFWRDLIDIPVDVQDEKNSLPDKYALKQNYPNPFNPVTRIEYQIPERSYVTIKIYDVLGNEVATLVNEEKVIGSYEVDWNANGLPSGIYYYRLQANEFTQVKKMILIK